MSRSGISPSASAVGDAVGAGVGEAVGSSDGEAVGSSDGVAEGNADGCGDLPLPALPPFDDPAVGRPVGVVEGLAEGIAEGWAEGKAVPLFEDPPLPVAVTEMAKIAKLISRKTTFIVACGG